VQLIRDFAPDIIMVTPSYMLAILDEFRRQGVDPRSTSLRIGIFGAEPWATASAPRSNRPSTSMPATSTDCRRSWGPASPRNSPAPSRVRPSGRIISSPKSSTLTAGRWRTASRANWCSRLTKEAMPIIRYRTRDLTRLLPGTVTRMRRMAKISGRSDDMLIIRGVNVFPSQIEEMILRCAGLAPHYAIEVRRPNRLDEISIVVEARPEIAHDAHRAQAELLAAKLKEQHWNIRGHSSGCKRVRCRARPARPAASRIIASKGAVRAAAVSIAAAMLTIGLLPLCRAQQPPAVMDDVVVTGERTGPGMCMCSAARAGMDTGQHVAPAQGHHLRRSRWSRCWTARVRCWCKSPSKSASRAFCGC